MIIMVPAAHVVTANIFLFVVVMGEATLVLAMQDVLFRTKWLVVVLYYSMANIISIYHECKGRVENPSQGRRLASQGMLSDDKR